MIVELTTEKFFKSGDIPLKASNQNIENTLIMAEQMITLADTGDKDRQDVGCGVLYGIVRDSAYRIKKWAEREKKNHIEMGKWD